MEAARGEGGGSTHDFFILAVDEALADPTASPLPMTMLDALHEEEGDSEVTTHTPLNHGNEADEADEEQNAGFNVLLMEGDVTLPVVVSGTDYVEFLEKEVLSGSLLDARNQRQKKKIWLKLAGDLKVLPPANPSLDLDFDISQWRYIVNELIKEMRVVESQCSLEICNSGVYVLTCTPYNAFLEMLAATLSN